MGPCAYHSTAITVNLRSSSSAQPPSTLFRTFDGPRVPPSFHYWHQQSVSPLETSRASHHVFTASGSPIALLQRRQLGSRQALCSVLFRALSCIKDTAPYHVNALLSHIVSMSDPVDRPCGHARRKPPGNSTIQPLVFIVLFPIS